MCLTNYGETTEHTPQRLMHQLRRALNVCKYTGKRLSTLYLRCGSCARSPAGAVRDSSPLTSDPVTHNERLKDGIDWREPRRSGFAVLYVHWLTSVRAIVGAQMQNGSTCVVKRSDWRYDGRRAANERRRWLTAGCRRQTAMRSHCFLRMEPTAPTANFPSLTRRYLLVGGTLLSVKSIYLAEILRVVARSVGRWLGKPSAQSGQVRWWVCVDDRKPAKR
jgi:hypothetical protein